MNRLICLIGLFALVSATDFEDCGSSGKVSKVEVTNCPDGGVCHLTKGTKPSISIAFQSQTKSNTVTAVVHGIIAGIALPFHLPPSQVDGCKFGVTCPMTSGKTFNYTNAIDVKAMYPPLAVTVQWELQDDAQGDIVCVKINSKID